MPDITGLPAFVDGVAAYLQANGIDATVTLGWHEDAQQVNEGPGTANRIVVQPGDPSGGAGALEAPRQIGPGPTAIWPPKPASGIDKQSPDDVVARELADWAESATVFVWACDPAAPEDDRRQYIATRALLQWFLRAATNTARAAFEHGKLEWVNAKNTERQYGRELALEITYHAPLFDVADELAHPQHLDPQPTFVTTQ